MVDCPICSQSVKEANINAHIDSGCENHVDTEVGGSQMPAKQFSNYFQKATSLPSQTLQEPIVPVVAQPVKPEKSDEDVPAPAPATPATTGLKRSFDESSNNVPSLNGGTHIQSKRSKPSGIDKRVPLAERMRPKTLDDVCGQELVGPSGILRGLIEQDRVPSMVFWGGPGTGKLTISMVAHV